MVLESNHVIACRHISCNLFDFTAVICHCDAIHAPSSAIFCEFCWYSLVTLKVLLILEIEPYGWFSQLCLHFIFFFFFFIVIRPRFLGFSFVVKVMYFLLFLSHFSYNIQPVIKSISLILHSTAFFHPNCCLFKCSIKHWCRVTAMATTI